MNLVKVKKGAIANPMPQRRSPSKHNKKTVDNAMEIEALSFLKWLLIFACAASALIGLNLYAVSKDATMRMENERLLILDSKCLRGAND